MKRLIISVFLVMLLFNLAYADTALTKLGRGAANIGSCWVELFKQVHETGESDGTIAAMSEGVVKGFAYSVGRFFAGIYDVITFPIPLPRGYKSIIYPDLVLSDTEGVYKGF
ncbi:MAG: exosortase system-associated protein, TIGR04073 family [Candidatus Omnitrophica bacterium]|nr:exosortase system-associated protein, TIGR04073 family [Candidatus Omnitrophota bacterium]